MNLKPLKTLLPAAVILLCLSSCEKTKRSETTSQTTRTDTTTVVKEETKVRPKTDDEVQEFKKWVNEKTSHADSNAKEKWPEIKESFRTRTAQLEQKMDSFSAESRREFEESKARYQAWENRRDARTSKPLNLTGLDRWRKDLLGNFSNLKTVTAANVRESYLTFMGAIRAKKDKWTQNDWDYVDAVYGELNDRKREIENQISTADALKIKTLQAEYLTLEAAADARDAGNSMKK
jgi:hypothetical protein